MAWTNVGFDGTINEAQWASLAGLLGNDYVAAGNGDCLVTAVPGARSVSVAAGSLYGDGILSTNSAPETVAMTTPVNGQWYVIALRRTWATNTAALVAIAGATTTTTTPTAPPTSFPTLNTNKGVLTDQPIAWAWCNSANTTVVVYDIRLKAVKSLPPVVANANERDAKFMSPSQGLQVWRDDIGAVETYFGLYNASTNPGGRDAAGWYSTNRSSGLIPIQPTSVSIASGTGSATSIGKINFSNATAININGCFSDKYTSYFVIARGLSSTAEIDLWVRLRISGADDTATNYANNGPIQNGSTLSSYLNTGGTKWVVTGLPNGTFGLGSFAMTLHNVGNSTNWKSFTSQGSGYGGGNIKSYFQNGFNASVAAYDGISIIPSSGQITGSVEIFGIVG